MQQQQHIQHMKVCREAWLAMAIETSPMKE